MRKLFLSALAALSLGVAVVPAANAAWLSTPQHGQHQGSYDTTGHGPQETGLEGGGG
jgi:hypothetical protein